MRFTSPFNTKEYARVFGAQDYGVYGADYLVKTPIGDSGLYDLTNCYPFASTYPLEWSTLPDEDPNLVCSYWVTNPTAPKPDWWADIVKECNEHYIVDNYDYSKIPENHKRNIKKNLASVSVETIIPSGDTLAQAQLFYWLYSNLKERHKIEGLADFTLAQINYMLETPGCILFKAVDTHTGVPLGMAIFYAGYYCSYYWLAAYSEVGYERNVGFILMHEALTKLDKLGFNLVVLGAGRGEGLSRYKRGFSSYSKKNYIALNIHNKEAYLKLLDGKNNDFVPMYRG